MKTRLVSTQNTKRRKQYKKRDAVRIQCSAIRQEIISSSSIKSTNPAQITSSIQRSLYKVSLVIVLIAINLLCHTVAIKITTFQDDHPKYCKSNTL